MRASMGKAVMHMEAPMKIMALLREVFSGKSFV